MRAGVLEKHEEPSHRPTGPCAVHARVWCRTLSHGRSIEPVAAQDRSTTSREAAERTSHHGPTRFVRWASSRISLSAMCGRELHDRTDRTPPCLGATRRCQNRARLRDHCAAVLDVNERPSETFDATRVQSSEITSRHRPFVAVVSLMGFAIQIPSWASWPS